jgi:nucleoside 2-deoxyribosyltransferase
MKKIYLSAAHSRRIEASELAEELLAVGVYVHSSWLWIDDAISSEKFLRDRAYADIREIQDCDIFVRLSDKDCTKFVPAGLVSGGRMFETGLAWALGKPIYIVGGPQNLFDRLDNFVHVKDKQELKRALCPWQIN